jgi:hypothetical protein
LQTELLAEGIGAEFQEIDLGGRRRLSPLASSAPLREVLALEFDAATHVGQPAGIEQAARRDFARLVHSGDLGSPGEALALRAKQKRVALLRQPGDFEGSVPVSVNRAAGHLAIRERADMEVAVPDLPHASQHCHFAHTRKDLDQASE